MHELCHDPLLAVVHMTTSVMITLSCRTHHAVSEVHPAEPGGQAAPWLLELMGQESLSRNIIRMSAGLHGLSPLRIKASAPLSKQRQQTCRD